MRKNCRERERAELEKKRERSETVGEEREGQSEKRWREQNGRRDSGREGESEKRRRGVGLRVRKETKGRQ